MYHGKTFDTLGLWVTYPILLGLCLSYLPRTIDFTLIEFPLITNIVINEMQTVMYCVI